MSIPTFLSGQSLDRKEILSVIHEVIVKTDKNVKAEIGSMMGKEMIMYNASGVFKYGLSSVKTHMSLHVLPIYCVPDLHSKYEKLLVKARFQKGCINFKHQEEMPLIIVRQLLEDCAKVDMVAVLERLKKQPKQKT